MINKHKETILEEKDIIDNIVCNRCGNPVHTAKDMCGNTMFIDYINFKKCNIQRQRFPEFVKEIDLCEDCINEIVSEFAIPIEKIKI